jgi:hypothetical protein
MSTPAFPLKAQGWVSDDGVHDSGRTSRDLDRHDVDRQGEALVGDFDALRRADQELEP